MNYDANTENTLILLYDIGNSATVEGYVHLLSDVNTAANGKTKYFEFQMQTSESDTVQLVCFSPEKRVHLKQSQEKRCAVQISPTKKSPKRTGNFNDQFIVDKKSKIISTKLDFTFNDSFNNRYHTVQQALDADLFKTVDVKVKVMMKADEKEPIYIKGLTKFKVDSTIADATNAMKLTIWENCVPKIQTGKSYHIQNCKIHVFNDKKYLSTNEKTVITQISDIKDVNLRMLEDQDCLLTASCVGLDVKVQTTCMFCNKEISSSAPETELITCGHCKISSLATTVNKKIVCQLVLKSDDGKINNYTAFNDAVKSFLTNVGCVTPVNDIDNKELTLLFLKAGPQLMIADNSVKVIAQFLKSK